MKQRWGFSLKKKKKKHHESMSAWFLGGRVYPGEKAAALQLSQGLSSVDV